MTSWDPSQYLAFSDERSRPFFDLVARIGAPADAVGAVVDLGCGPGGLTATLAQRWPAASVTGVDSSADMLAQAAKLDDAGGRLAFVQADLSEWAPGGPLDVIVSNAALQWVPGHQELLARFVSWLQPGGWLAFQVPGNFRSPSHALLADLRRSARWAGQVGEGADRHLAVEDPAGYAERLVGLGCRADAWETTYLHLLDGPDPVLEWVKGTGLRPVLDRLEGADREAFLAEYGAALRTAYPAWPSGLTPLPFRRIFVVAQRQG